MISVTIPLRTVSEANRHEHWRKRQKRAKGQRDAAGLFVVSEGFRTMRFPVSAWLKPIGKGGRGIEALSVMLTRLAPRGLDSDNAVGAMKHVRDGVADALGIDDRDPRVTWLYAQEKAKTYGVRIEIRRAT